MKLFGPTVAVVLSFLGMSRGQEENTVAVVGGGVSGLTAAYNLEKRGYKVTLFESNSRVGGKVESVYLPNGAPALGIVALSDEMKQKAEALCGGAYPTELGAVIATGSNIQVLADELDVPYGDFILDPQVVLSQGNNTLKIARQDFGSLVALELAQQTQTTPQAVVAQAAQALQNVVGLFPEITTARIDQSQADLAMPMSEFAMKYNLTFWVEALRPIVVGYGYGYLETVPAGILLPYMYRTIAAGLGLLTDSVAISFPCGFQSLMDAMADALQDVRLSAPVTSITRNNEEGFITVEAMGQPSMQFAHAVIATTLDLVPAFMDVNQEEKVLFESLVMVRYVTTVTEIEGSNGTREVEFYADQGFAQNINSVNIVAMADLNTSAEVTYQIINETLTGDQAFAILDTDMESYWGGSATGVIAQRVTNNYFPTVSAEDFANGFYDKMEALQGVNGTYYVGSHLSFETVTFAEEFARDLVERKFPMVSTSPTMVPSSTARNTMMPSKVPTGEPSTGSAGSAASTHLAVAAAFALVIGSVLL